MKYIVLSIVAIVVGTSLGLGHTYYEFAVRPSRFALGGLDAVPAANSEQSDQTNDKSSVEVVNGETHDFGSMDSNTKGSHTFVFKNTGQKPLKIKVHQTSCKCTVADLPNGHIEPGKTAEVTLEWEPKAEEVEFSQSAQIQTTDSLRTIVVLRVVGQIRRQMFADPIDILYANISTNETMTSYVRLMSHEHEKIEFKECKFGNPDIADHFEVEVEDMSKEEAYEYAEAKCGLLVTVTLKPGLPHGPINQSLHLITNVQEKGGKVIPIRGEIVGDITFHGRPRLNRDINRLSFGVIEKGESREETIHLVVRGPFRDDVKLSIAEDGIHPSDLIKTEIGEPKTVGKTRMYPIKITVLPSDRRIVLNGPKFENYGRIEITTTHPNDKKITLFLGFIVEG